MTAQSRTFSLAMAVGCALSLWTASASAQGFNRIDRPFNRPTVSPYINLMRGGNGAVLNYFGAVRPQLDFYENEQQLDDRLDSVQQRQNSQFNQRMPNRIPGVYTMGATGHAAGFMTIRSGGANSNSGQGLNLYGTDSGSGQFGGSQFGGSSFGGQDNFGGQAGGFSGHSSGFGYSGGNGF
ncbi:MAG: hypothetical protein R3C49_07210 [Planctomycetaceae bacterium]